MIRHWKGPAMSNIEDFARMVVHQSYLLHREFGPGMLESAYEGLLHIRLQKQGLLVQRQVPIPLRYEGVELEEAFRIDLLLEGQLVVELKAVERTSPVHQRQVLTYLKLMKLPLGLLINFGATTIREGINRVVNNHTELPRASTQTGAKAQP
jgi:GxxExxY protein